MQCNLENLLFNVLGANVHLPVSVQKGNIIRIDPSYFSQVDADLNFFNLYTETYQ